MAKFTDLLFDSPERKKMWRNHGAEAVALLKQINAEVFGGRGSVQTDAAIRSFGNVPALLEPNAALILPVPPRGILGSLLSFGDELYVAIGVCPEVGSPTLLVVAVFINFSYPGINEGSKASWSENVEAGHLPATLRGAVKAVLSW